jgi:predicted HNH restriction endonuclease
MPFEPSIPLGDLLRDFDVEIRTEIESARPPYYPFTVNAGILRLNQGQYLTRCTPLLFQHIKTLFEIDSVSAATTGALRDNSAVYEFGEGRRMSAERQFFARNPALVAAAKKKHGFVCQICNFDFGRAYGPLGEGYIEAHHLNPLSERDPSTWTDKLRTSVNEVCVLCSNGHRMVHRRRPALSIDEVRKVLRI